MDKIGWGAAIVLFPQETDTGMVKEGAGLYDIGLGHLANERGRAAIIVDTEKYYGGSIEDALKREVEVEQRRYDAALNLARNVGGGILGNWTAYTVQGENVVDQRGLAPYLRWPYARTLLYDNTKPTPLHGGSGDGFFYFDRSLPDGLLVEEIVLESIVLSGGYSLSGRLVSLSHPREAY